MQYNEWYEVHTQYKPSVELPNDAGHVVKLDTYEEALEEWKIDCNDWGVKKSTITRHMTVELAHHGKASAS